MRRLPIYFLIDISESMVGEPIEQVQDGIATIIKELKTDPYALETVWISIIGFAGKSKTITPLQDVITFYPPKIPIGSGTSLSKGLTELMHAIDRDVIKTTYEKKGDWKPVIFLFTDGIPTDNTDKEILQWNTHYKNRCNLIIISIGDNTNYNLLGKLSDQVLLFNNTNTGSYKEFFKWVTASIKTTSEKINTSNSEGLDLSKINSAVIEQIDITKQYQSPDNNFVVLNGKCSQTKKQYLIKFKKSFENSNIMDMQLGFTKLKELSKSMIAHTKSFHLKIIAIIKYLLKNFTEILVVHVAEIIFLLPHVHVVVFIAYPIWDPIPVPGVGIQDFMVIPKKILISTEL